MRGGNSTDPAKVNAYRAVTVNGSSGTAARVQIDGIDITDETVGTTTGNISRKFLQTTGIILAVGLEFARSIQTYTQ